MRAWRNRSRPEDADLGAPAGWEAFALLVGDFRLHLAVRVRRLLPLLRGRVRGESTRCVASSPCPSTRAARSGSTASRRPTPRCLSRWSSSLSYCGLTSPIKGSGRGNHRHRADAPSARPQGLFIGGIPTFRTGVAAGTLAEPPRLGCRGRMPLRERKRASTRSEGRERRARRPGPPRRPRPLLRSAEVLPPRDHPVYRDALPGPPITSATDVEAARLGAVTRGSRATTTPRRVPELNGSAIVLGEDDAIAVEDDVACGALGCWRPLVKSADVKKPQAKSA